MTESFTGQGYEACQISEKLYQALLSMCMVLNAMRWASGGNDVVHARIVYRMEALPSEIRHAQFRVIAGKTMTKAKKSMGEGPYNRIGAQRAAQQECLYVNPDLWKPSHRSFATRGDHVV